MPNIKQIHHPYHLWEDFKNGMYCGTTDNDPDLIEKAKSLLSNTKLFYSTAKEILTRWPISSSVNLSNVGINRRAWIGQAACSYLHSVPETLTRVAWMELNDIQRFEANTVAEKIILIYEQTQKEETNQSGLF